jgi:DNA-binding response OmpR family regulator
MRLLLVEDESRFAHALRRGLSAEGFSVDLAGDGLAGLEAARHGDYAVVLLDVMLPRLSGYDVVRALRKERNWVPVMMISAKDGPHDQADGLDYGADDYLVKPFSFVVLLARLRALLRRGARPRPTALTAGAVTLDPAAREVRFAGAPVALTPREYAVLEHLMRHPDRAVTKQELLDEVWDAADEGDANVVEVYVGYLRRKLGKESILTVRGAGYRIGRG